MRWWALALVLSACSTTPRTEVVIVVDSDLSVPAELDRIDVAITGPDMRMQSSFALLGADEPPLPRTLGVVHGGGALGPFDVEVIGSAGGTLVVSRTARFSFISRQTLALTMHLVRSCIGVSCPAGSACGERGCESVDRVDLLGWNGSPPRLGETPDAGMDASFDAPIDVASDACVPAIEDCANGMDDDCDESVDEGSTELCNAVDDDCDTRIDEELGAEVCNGIDDDCDTMVDEGFDLLNDPMNCGTCARQCVFRNGEGLCNAGDCQVTSCNPGFDDCDTLADNGCETNIAMSDSHCGSCGNRCIGSRSCCPSTMTCLRSSDCP